MNILTTHITKKITPHITKQINTAYNTAQHTCFIDVLVLQSIVVIRHAFVLNTEYRNLIPHKE
jgi:hypothetical protein